MQDLDTRGARQCEKVQEDASQGVQGVLEMGVRGARQTQGVQDMGIRDARHGVRGARQTQRVQDMGIGDARHVVRGARVARHGQKGCNMRVHESSLKVKSQMMVFHSA